MQYGNLLIVDPEEEFYAAEVTKVAADVNKRGLGLIVFAEWYNVDIMAKMRFFDDNTRAWWTPITGEAAGAQHAFLGGPANHSMCYREHVNHPCAHLGWLSRSSLWCV